MATIAQQPLASPPGNERFFVRGALVMTVVIVAGFSVQWLMRRSTFQAPLRVHLHAFLFMGWVGIYLLQNIFVATDRMAFHRRLGWIAGVWMVPMVVAGCYATVEMVRNGQVPFVFKPLHFLIFDAVTVLAFVALTSAALVLRRQTQWHRRLHFCGMSMLLMPAIGRLLPMPLLMPYAWESAFAASVLFPLAGVLSDMRRGGSAHPAWRWGIGTMLAAFVLIDVLTYGPLGPGIYHSVTDGSPGAGMPPLAFGTPPQAD